MVLCAGVQDENQRSGKWCHVEPLTHLAVINTFQAQSSQMKRSKKKKKDENKKKKLSAHFINQPPKPSKGAKQALDLLGETSERRAMGKGRPDQRLRSFIVINTDCRSRFLPHSGILTSSVSEIMATGSPGRF